MVVSTALAWYKKSPVTSWTKQIFSLLRGGDSSISSAYWYFTQYFGLMCRYG